MGDQIKKICQNCKNEFPINKEDFSFYDKMQVPSPTFCPECRLVRRLIWRNERSLYKRTCDLCDKKIISMYDSYVIFPVYCTDCWRSDSWDPISYGQDYDFSKPFFEQWRELFLKVPRKASVQIGDCINTDYANFVKDSRNVYLAYSVIYGAENVSYSSNIDNSKAIIDSYNIIESELLYENIGSSKNYNCKYSYWSSSSIDCDFILDCVNCQDCFGCVNLRNKKFCIWNEQYEKTEYENRIKDLNVGSYKSKEEISKKFWDFSLKFPRKYVKAVNCVNSSGDELRNCKNINEAFSVYYAENSKFVYRAFNVKDSMDICYINAERVYEHTSGGSDQGSDLKFVINGGVAVSESEYIDLCQSGSNMFGCIGVKSKSYCILNKEYTKEEYKTLIGKIKEHMNDMPYIDKKGNIYKYGEFFPYTFSPFGYNETVINDHYPLSKEQITQKGYNFKEKIENKYTVTKKASELTDEIKYVDDSILDEVIECAVTKKPFKITQYELEFYRRMNIPIPRIHHDERYKRRLTLKNPMKLWHRKCMKEKCDNEFETTYSPERPEIIYCENHYKQDVY